MWKIKIKIKGIYIQILHLYQKLTPNPVISQKCNITKLLEENTGENQGNLGVGNNFLDTILKA